MTRYPFPNRELNMPLIDIKIVQHKLSDTPNNGHVEAITLLHYGGNTIILLIDLHTKYKKVGSTGGGEDEDGWHSFWIGDDEIKLRLPEGFERCTMFADTARYTSHLCIYSHDLLEEMDAPALLWGEDTDFEPEPVYNQPAASLCDICINAYTQACLTCDYRGLK